MLLNKSYKRISLLLAILFFLLINSSLSNAYSYPGDFYFYRSSGTGKIRVYLRGEKFNGYILNLPIDEVETEFYIDEDDAPFGTYEITSVEISMDKAYSYHDKKLVTPWGTYYFREADDEPEYDYHDTINLNKTVTITSKHDLYTIRLVNDKNGYVGTTSFGNYVSIDIHFRLISELNNPPTTPSSITVPSTVREGEPFNISWSSSSDPDGDSISYRLERQVNGGSWSQVYSGSSRSYTDTPQKSWNTVTYRVRAYDGTDYSSYRTSNTVTVIHNTNPTITISLPTANSYYGKNSSSNTIPLQATINDVDVGDVLKAYYRIDGSTGQAGTQFGSNITSTGSGQTVSGTIPLDTIASLSSGNHTLYMWVEDNQGGKSSELSITIKIDNTAPVVNPPTVTAIDTNSIEIKANATDSHSGIEEYIFNRDGIDISSWITNSVFIDSGLNPNQKYSYIYKAKDKLNNISEYSSPINRYTLALNPIKVKHIDSTDKSITLEITNNPDNTEVPETMIILKERGTNIVASTSSWSKDTTKTLIGLQVGKEYEVYLNTRNGDKIENGEIKLNSSSHPQLVDDNDNPIDYVVTVVPVSNFKVVDSSTNSIIVSWDKASNQEYQIFLKDEHGNEIADTRSNWITDNTYKFNNLPLPNTKYVPYITTRRIGTSSSLTPVKVLNEERAYTDAENLTYADFEPFDTSIKITLDTSKSKNPNDTQYILRNDINSATHTVTHSNPVWEDTNLAQESYYTYSVKVIHKNGKPSDFFRLIFNSGDPHTTLPEFNLPIIEPQDYIDLDRLKTWDITKPIDYFVPSELNNKYVKHNDIIYYTTKEQAVTINNEYKVNALNYAVSDDGYGYTKWKPLNEGLYNEKIEFNVPGKYKVHLIFKNYNVESDPLIINYYVDWIKPTINGEPAIKGQSAVTDNKYVVNIIAEDMTSPYLFYTLDDGHTWYLLKEGQDTITFDITDDMKSSEGKLNILKIKVCDIAGNVIEKTFNVWGISK